MRLPSRIAHACRNLFRRSGVEAELDDELRAATETLEARYAAAGMNPVAARRAARLAVGGEAVKDAVRDVRAGVALETCVADSRYALRTLRKSPAFTTAAVLSLALGIGANAAIFTFINALLLRPLPVHDPSALVDIAAQRKGGDGFVSFPMYRDIAARQEVMTGIVATAGETPYRVTVPGGAGRAAEVDNVRISFVSGNYFAVLGLDPQLGRLLAPADDRTPDSAAAAGAVIVLSDGFWNRQFARDPAIVGRTVLVGRVRCEVIGVAPRGFVGEVIGNAADGWVPLTPFSSRDDLDNRLGTFTAFFGRLKPGVRATEAQANLTRLFQRLLAEEGLQNTAVEDNAIALRSAAAGLDFSLRRTYLKPLFIVMGMVALVLLIACANVANLLLARAAARRGEISVRLALGCSRTRLVRQLLTESLLLSAAGAAAGLAISRWATGMLARMILGGPVGLRLSLAPDARVLAFLGTVAVLTAVLFGLAPALRSTRVDLAPALKGLRRASGGGSRQRAGRALVIGQVALSLLLLVGAGLLVRSVRNLHHQDVGFSLDRVLVFSLAHNPSSREPAAMAAVARAARERVLALPGVEAASLSGIMIFSPSDIGSPFWIPGEPARAGDPPVARYNSVTSGYFETLGMRVVAGRSFTDRDDTPGAPAVTVVNESFARRFFPRGAVGRTIAMRRPGAGTSGAPAAASTPGRTVAIVGVVHDAKYNDLRAATKPMFFLPFAQMTRSLRSLEIRTRQSGTAVAAPVREALSSVTRDIMIREVSSLGAQVDRSLAAERLMLTLCVLFGALALALACVGLYGVIAYSVAQRTAEIGLRVALGATPLTVIRGVLGETLVLVLAGTGIGILAALFSTRLLVSFLYGLTPRDPATVGLATAILLAAAGVAAVLPALRAARVDPNVALRYE